MGSDINYTYFGGVPEFEKMKAPRRGKDRAVARSRNQNRGFPALVIVILRR